MQNEGGTIFSKKSEFYVRKNIDFASFSQYFGDCCRHIGSGMRGLVCNFFEGVVDIRSQEWWRVEMDN